MKIWKVILDGSYRHIVLADDYQDAIDETIELLYNEDYKKKVKANPKEHVTTVRLLIETENDFEVVE